MGKDKELDNFARFKHKVREDESYYLTILDNNGLNTINVKSLNKEKMTFGKAYDNDIVIASEFVNEYQGYLELTEYGVLAVNTSNQIYMFGNNNKAFANLYLSEGSFVKFANPNLPTIQGVVFIMSIGKNMDEWKNYTLQPGRITLGSGGSCDIILPPAGIAKHHATINISGNSMTIRDENTRNGTYVNGAILPKEKNGILHNLDVIVIGNSKILIYGDKIYYQIFERGIQLDAIDIVKKVKIKFKPKIIASHISMTIKPTEFVAFIGGSGAGKSTFLKCISGVNKPTSGTVFLNGENLYENYEELKHNIGYVPQDDIVYSNLTLHDMLNYAAKLRMPDSTTKQEREKRIKEVLEIVQLSGFENSYIRQLSGGQRKRASIAVELIADPSLFFLDEPTSGLDPGTERSIMQTLRKMSQMGKTIILVTHNTLNLHLCDKVAFFGEGGYLCFYGTPQEALEFFGVDDFVDIYTIINKDVKGWLEKFENMRPPIKPREEVTPDKSNKVVKKKKSFMKQLIVLIHRYVKLIINDHQQLLLLFAQAPIVALLITIVSNSELYESYEITKALLFALGCACLWIGLTNSVQEICKEKVILQKEHMADLKLSAYLLSKFIVQGILAFIQATLIVGTLQVVTGQSEYSILLGPFWDIQIICFLSILATAAIGLFISSLVNNASSATSIVPIVLVPQLLFSGMFFDLNGITAFISNFILCRWTMEGLGMSANLNALTHLVQKYSPLIEVEPEAHFIFTTEHMLQVIGVISAMTIVLMIGSYVVLRRNVNKNM